MGMSEHRVGVSEHTGVGTYRCRNIGASEQNIGASEQNIGASEQNIGGSADSSMYM